MDNASDTTFQIELTQGLFALVSAEDYDRVSRFKWCMCRTRNLVYAKRGDYSEGKHRTVRMHRFIMDAPEGMDVDHVNGNGLDNRRENLRVCTQKQNAANTRMKKDSTTGYKGVYRIGPGWGVNAFGRYLGIYDSPIEAARAYDTAARISGGDFAKLNFPDETISVAPRVGGPPHRNTSGYRGVSFRKDEGKWTARLRYNGRRLHLGYFPAADLAAAAIEAKQKELGLL